MKRLQALAGKGRRSTFQILFAVERFYRAEQPAGDQYPPSPANVAAVAYTVINSVAEHRTFQSSLACNMNPSNRGRECRKPSPNQTQ